MTLKKQFKLLTILTTAIPLLCLLFLICEQHVIHSYRKRFMENTAVELVNSQKISHFLAKEREAENAEQELNSDFFSEGLIQFLRTIPKDVHYILVSNDAKYIYASTIPELEEKENTSPEELQNYIISTSADFIYQLTIPKHLKGKMILITRAPKQTLGFWKNFKYILVNLSLLIFVITICIIFTIVLIENLNKSVQSVQEQTIKLAEGKLDEAIPVNPTGNRNEITIISESLEKMRK